MDNCLKYEITSETTILILGSFPGVRSLKRNRYYADPCNDFWDIISEVISEDITSLSYNDKIQKINNRGIGLWDVIKSCKRIGSRDKNIDPNSIIKNDFESLRMDFPNIKRVCFNGKKAASYEKLLNDSGFNDTKKSPSSSRLNTTKCKIKSQRWSELIGPFLR